MLKKRPVKLFSITRLPQKELVTGSFLGKSMSRFPPPLQPVVSISAGNSGDSAVGLSEYYNRCLDSCDPDDIALFIHDDVYIHSWYLVDQLREAIKHYAIVGLAGSSTPDLKQPSWGLAFSETLELMGWQQEAGFSGSISHSTPEAPQISCYGDVPAPCLLLDGLFLAVDVGKVIKAGVRFDPQFRFHCYDIDFCRSASKAGLSMGTWGISVTHASSGGFDSDAWREAARRYLKKWQ